MRKSNDSIWLYNDGWNQFVKSCSVCPKDLLLFRYDGACRFLVRIFDQSRLEASYPQFQPKKDYRIDHPPSPITTNFEGFQDADSENYHLEASQYDDFNFEQCNTPFPKITYNKYIIRVINKRACHIAFQNYLNRIKTI